MSFSPSPSKFDLGDFVTLKTGYKGVIWKVTRRRREHPKAVWEYRIEAQEPYDINFMLGPFIDVEESAMNAVSSGGDRWTKPPSSVYNTDMTQLDVSSLTDQQLLDLKSRMEGAGKRLSLVQENLDAAIVSLQAAVEKVENAAKILPLDDPPTPHHAPTNEAWRISAQLIELLEALRMLKYK